MGTKDHKVLHCEWGSIMTKTVDIAFTREGTHFIDNENGGMFRDYGKNSLMI